MLRWAAILLVLAVIFAILGFGGLIVGALAQIAEILFWVFVVLFVASLLFGRRVFR